MAYSNSDFDRLREAGFIIEDESTGSNVMGGGRVYSPVIVSVFGLRELLRDILLIDKRLITFVDRSMNMMGDGLRDKIKSNFGKYVYGIPRLDESTQRIRVKEGYPPDEPLLRSKMMRDSITVEHDSPLGAGGRVDSSFGVFSENEYIHEQIYGSTRTPPRDIITPTIDEYLPKMLAAFEDGVNAVIEKMGGSGKISMGNYGIDVSEYEGDGEYSYARRQYFSQPTDNLL